MPESNLTHYFTPENVASLLLYQCHSLSGTVCAACSLCYFDIVTKARYVPLECPLYHLHTKAQVLNWLNEPYKDGE